MNRALATRMARQVRKEMVTAILPNGVKPSIFSFCFPRISKFISSFKRGGAAREYPSYPAGSNKGTVSFIAEQRLFEVHLIPGWHKLCNPASRLWGFFQFMMIFEDFWGFLWSQRVKMRPLRRWKGCPQSSILNLQSSVLSPQSSEMPKNNVFAPKNLIYGILVANVARISTYALWG